MVGGSGELGKESERWCRYPRLRSLGWRPYLRLAMGRNSVVFLSFLAEPFRTEGSSDLRSIWFIPEAFAQGTGFLSYRLQVREPKPAGS